jgi:hypothetical protein
MFFFWFYEKQELTDVTMLVLPEIAQLRSTYQKHGTNHALWKLITMTLDSSEGRRAHGNYKTLEFMEKIIRRLTDE